MARYNYNFSEESLRIPLPQPIWFTPTGGEEIIINEVELQRLHALEISRLKSAMSRIQPGNEMSLTMAAKEFLDLSVVRFYANGEPFDKAGVQLLIKRLPVATVFKLFMFTVMLTKESSFVSTNYKCPICSKTTMFDLDPDSPIPDNIEAERALMENFMEFYDEKVNKSEKTVKYSLKHPIYLDPVEGPDLGTGDDDGRSKKASAKKDTRIPLYHIIFRWPELGDYIKAASDPRRTDPELFAFFETIVGFNDLSEEETKTLRLKNGFEKIFGKMRIDDLNGMTSMMDKYGPVIEHRYTCKNCGSDNPVGFDFTNFFDFQRR